MRGLIICYLVVFIFNKELKSQSKFGFENKSDGKSVVEKCFENNSKIRENVNWLNFNGDFKENVKQDSIYEKFVFGDYFLKQTSFHEILESEIVQNCDSILSENIMSKTTVTLIKNLSCCYKAKDCYYDNAFCLQLREVTTYYNEGMVKSINTINHYFWYTEMYSNYLAHYEQSILHNQSDIVFDYKENFKKNLISDLDANFKNKKFKGINVYPNPISSNMLNLNYYSNYESKELFELFDSSMRLIFRINLKSYVGNNNHTIDIGKQNSGIYILKSTVNSYPFTNKIIID